jgi:hypothetical protein
LSPKSVPVETDLETGRTREKAAEKWGVSPIPDRVAGPLIWPPQQMRVVDHVSNVRPRVMG